MDMQYSFTPAAERALTYASGWSIGAGREELGAEALLVGLLAEPECRAALMLARLAVDLPLVRKRWPTLVNDAPRERGGPRRKAFSTDVECSLQAASQRLACLPQPLELATEHILLGLAAADHEVAVWLRQRGLDPDALEAEIRNLYGREVEERGEGRREKGEERLAADDASAPELPRAAVPAAAKPPTLEIPRISTTAALRAIDAAANRAREGLRSGRGLRPLCVGRPAPDRTLQAVASRSDRRLVADSAGQSLGGP